MLEAPKDREITLEYFEILDENGNYLNTMFAPQKDIIISDGTRVLHEANSACTDSAIFGYAVWMRCGRKILPQYCSSTEKKNKSDFKCSDERLNRLYQNVKWSQYNNMMSVPTDCPTREKAGWTGDILIYARTALLNEEMTPFLTSALASAREDEQDDGVIRIVVPYMKLYRTLILQTVKKFGDDKVTGVAGWSDAIAGFLTICIG